MVNTNLYDRITESLIKTRTSISTMESCTAGLIATLLTNVPGSSEILKGAFVTYCNEAKIMQGVPSETITDCGVYSSETAIAMAKACKETYKSDIGIGITGTLDRIDPNNNKGYKDVYIAIIWHNKPHVRAFNIPEDIKGRLNRKFFVADEIGILLFQLIEKDKLRKDIIRNMTGEIKELADFHSVEVPVVYGDGTESLDKVLPLDELGHILYCIQNPEEEGELDEI